MGKTRETANLVSENNVFVDVTNNRTGVGKNNPATKLDVDGTITCIDLNSTSDINLKENISSIQNSIKKVLQINGIHFDWKETKESSMGVIAQEVEKVFPELVNNEGENKSVKYNGLIAVLIEAIKEQQNQINSMNNEIEKLKNGK